MLARARGQGSPSPFQAMPSSWCCAHGDIGRGPQDARSGNWESHAMALTAPPVQPLNFPRSSPVRGEIIKKRKRKKAPLKKHTSTNRQKRLRLHFAQRQADTKVHSVPLTSSLCRCTYLSINYTFYVSNTQRGIQKMQRTPSRAPQPLPARMFGTPRHFHPRLPEHDTCIGRLHAGTGHRDLYGGGPRSPRCDWPPLR